MKIKIINILVLGRIYMVIQSEIVDNLTENERKLDTMTKK